MLLNDHVTSSFSGCPSHSVCKGTLRLATATFQDPCIFSVGFRTQGELTAANRDTSGLRCLRLSMDGGSGWTSLCPSHDFILTVEVFPSLVLC